MSSIEKLGIQGIRSFGPGKVQIIAFGKPLTVIVGPNGCGKTTIIESLKYATTGCLPPGAKSGQSFIHDPKIAQTQEVKAQIKLMFKNKGKEQMVVIRSFKLTQKRTKLEFKAMDSVLKTAKDGEQSSISHRCSDMDKLVPDFLGVSKAILENVIFCHQEDSNWPLQEGAVLKKKFDDIFESTRYTKALDALRKEGKTQKEAQKDAKRDLDVLNEQLKQVHQLRDRKDELKERIAEMNTAAQRKQGRIEDEAEKGDNENDWAKTGGQAKETTTS